jgi:hypothetical protein
MSELKCYSNMEGVNSNIYRHSYGLMMRAQTKQLQSTLTS